MNSFDEPLPNHATSSRKHIIVQTNFPAQGDFNLHHRDLIYAMVYNNPYLTYQLNQVP